MHDAPNTSDPARELLKLLSDGSWHAREALAARTDLGIDELTVQLANLENLGLALVQNDVHGVRLASPLHLLDRERIMSRLRSSLRESLCRINVDFVIDSTNAAALRWLREGGTGRAVFLAEKQQSGKGRRGRQWVGPMAQNIYLSAVWPVADLERSLEGFSLVTALSVVAGLCEAGIEGSDRLRVKWPNDVWLDGGKLAGILLELQTAGTGPAHVIIGIGINVVMPTEFRAEIPASVSDLATSSGVIPDRNVLVAALLNCLETRLERLDNQGFESFRQEWQRLDLYHRKSVEILDGKRRLQGIVAGVGATGALLLDTPDGRCQVSGGELAPSLRPTVESGLEESGGSR